MDWDTLDAGRLEYATSRAQTPDGSPIVVGVLDRPDRLADVLDDARLEGGDVPLWLYASAATVLPGLPAGVVLQRVPTGP